MNDDDSTPEVDTNATQDGVLRSALKDFAEDDCASMAAALAYYTVFSLPPLLVLILLIAGLFVDPIQLQEHLARYIESAAGADAAEAVTTMVANSQEKIQSTGTLSISMLLGIVGIMFGATGVFVQLQSALNKAWEVAPDESAGGASSFAMKRLVSLGMILVVAFLLLVSLVLSAALTTLANAIAGAAFGEIPASVLKLFQIFLSLALTSVLFSSMFRFLPDVRLRWRAVAAGGFATAVLFVVGQEILALYVRYSEPGSTFGAAGSLAVILVWIYYSAMIVLLGAELTQSWTRARGWNVRPEPGAKLEPQAERAAT